MIKSFRHKGLKRLYQTGKASGVQATHVSRLRMQLTALDTAQVIDDMDIPGFKLHPHNIKNNKTIDYIFVNCRKRSTEAMVMLKIMTHFQKSFPDRGFSVGEMLIKLGNSHLYFFSSFLLFLKNM